MQINANKVSRSSLILVAPIQDSHETSVPLPRNFNALETGG